MYTNTSAAAGLIIGSSYILRTEYIGLCILSLLCKSSGSVR